MEGADIDSGDLLVVDDNPGDIRLIEEAFRDSQIELTIHTAHTARDALDFVSGRGDFEDAPRPDAILLDWNLSNTTGKEVLEAAKSGDSDIPVIVMTGSNPESCPPDAPPSRADLYMQKPTEPLEYVETLRSLH